MKDIFHTVQKHKKNKNNKYLKKKKKNSTDGQQIIVPADFAKGIV